MRDRIKAPTSRWDKGLKARPVATIELIQAALTVDYRVNERIVKGRRVMDLERLFKHGTIRPLLHHFSMERGYPITGPRKMGNVIFKETLT